MDPGHHSWLGAIDLEAQVISTRGAWLYVYTLLETRSDTELPIHGDRHAEINRIEVLDQVLERVGRYAATAKLDVEVLLAATTLDRYA